MNHLKLNGATAALCLLLTASCSRDLDIPAPVPDQGYLSGRLVEAEPGTNLTRPVGQGSVAVASTNLTAASDANGNFVIGPLPQGAYRLQISATSVTGAQRQRLLSSIQVTRGATSALGDVSLKENAELAGRVLIGTQQAGNAGITVFVPGTDFVTTTADSGAWLLQQLPEGTVRASAFRPGYRPATTTDLDVQGGTVTSAIDLVITPEPPEKARILGSVLVLGAATSGGVTVRAVSLTAQKIVATQTTAADGSFALDSLDPDLYTLTAEAPDRPVSRVPNLAVGAGIELHADTIVLSLAGSSPGAPVQCTASGQCSAGQVCEGGSCVDCASGAQCESGSSCIGGRCQRDCASNADCAGEVCSAGRCRPCAATAECGDAARVCNASGQCVHCSARLDCGPGQACLATGCGSCSADGDCGGGATCVSGTCVAGTCSSNDECPFSRACVVNQCSSCSADGQCRAGQVCLAGACITGNCRTSAQCPGGEACLGYQCAACSADGDCGPGNLCLPTASGKRCGPGDCRATSDCSGPKSGQVCLGNSCTDCGQGVTCAQGQVCAPRSGGALRCLPADCVQPADCTGSESGWLCSANQCLSCGADGDCGALGAGLVCAQGACIAGDCTTRADCTGANAGKVCSSRRCVSCLPGDCALGESCTNGLCVAGTSHTVSVAVTGSGTVTSSPGAIACAGASGTCASVFNLGDRVTLTASPAPGFFFGGWGGVAGCGAASSCALVVTSDLAVAALFNAGAALSVSVSGPGVVASSPAAISCPGTCSAPFALGAAVTLAATPVTGYQLAGWTGGGCAGTGSCAVTVTQPTSVAATFVKQPVLTVAIGGAGSVASSPPGISCSASSGTCSAPFPNGTAVTLTETTSGVPFGGWLSGGCSGGAATCSLTLTADTTVTAAFGTVYTLALTAAGPGSVAASSGAIRGCGQGGPCSGGYPASTVVVLTATPQAGAALLGWTGDCGATQGSTCTLAMSQARAAGVSFTQVTALSLIQGDQQTGPIDSLLPGNLIVGVASVGTGAPLAGAAVALAGPPGSVVIPATATTDATGRATFAVRLSRTLGLQSFTATTPTAQLPLIATATAVAPAAGSIFTVIGASHNAGFDGIPGPATAAHIRTPHGLALAADGTLYVSDFDNHVIYSLSTAGVLALVAGTGVAGSTGDGGPATAALLSGPCDLALDETSQRRTLYVADYYNNTVRAIDLTQSPPLISLFAGGASPAGPGYGDGGPAVAASLAGPTRISLGPGDGYLYIGDQARNRIRRVDLSTRVIDNWVSVQDGFFCGYNACSVAFDGFKTPYLSRNLGYYNFGTYRVNAGLSLSLIAGAGTTTGDGVYASTAKEWDPSTMAFDAANNLLLTDPGAHWVRKVDATGRIFTLAGTGSAGSGGDYGPALQAQLNSPWTSVLSPAGDLIIADTANAAVRIVPGAGSSTAGSLSLSLSAGDGQVVAADQLTGPLSVKLLDPAGQPLGGYPVSWSVIDAGGALYASTAPTNASGIVSVQGRVGLSAPGSWRFSASAADLYGNPVRGSPVQFSLASTAQASGYLFNILNTSTSPGFDGFGAAATTAHIRSPWGMAYAADGTLYVSDSGDHAVYAVSAAGALTLLAGNGTCGNAGDGGLASSALLCGPADLALDESAGQRKLYVADSGNSTVRLIDLAASPPVISTFAGGGNQPGPSYGDGGPATAATFAGAVHIALGPDGYLYIGDAGGHLRIRRVNLSNGLVTNWLTNDCGFNACAVAFDAAGKAYVTRNLGYYYFAVYRVDQPDPAQSVTLMAGGFGATNTGDGVAAIGAYFYPGGLAVNGTNQLVLTDPFTHRVRVLSDLTTNATITTLAGTGVAGNGADGPSAPAVALKSPWMTAFGPGGRAAISDAGNSCVRMIWP